MPLLDRKGWATDVFRREDSTAAAIIAPFDLLVSALAARLPGQRIGVDLPNTTPPQALAAMQDQIDLIAVAFPKFSDGRGFSLGRSLREQRYAGTLRAIGPIIPDQFAFALQCGFDEVELSDEQAARQPIEQWLHALGVVDLSYQDAADGAPSIFKRRATAR